MNNKSWKFCIQKLLILPLLQLTTEWDRKGAGNFCETFMGMFSWQKTPNFFLTTLPPARPLSKIAIPTWKKQLSDCCLITKLARTRQTLSLHWIDIYKQLHNTVLAFKNLWNTGIYNINLVLFFGKTLPNTFS